MFADAEPVDTGIPPIPEVCPAPHATAILGDINGDGRVDVADPIALSNHLFRGGPAPACDLAADFNDDGSLELDDGGALNSYLVSGTQRARAFPAEEACGGRPAWADGPCAPLALELLGSNRVTASEFSVQLAIVSPALRVQGWSASIVTDGCTLMRASTDGTPAAEIWDAPAGVRHLGYSASPLVDRGAIAYTVLSMVEDAFLPEGVTPVLTIELSADVPASGCAQCRVDLAEDLFWKGRAITVAVAADGYSYRPALPSTVIDVCAP
jgi:dockerin type I repeat protein